MLEIAGWWINNIYSLAHTPLYVFHGNCKLDGKNRRRNAPLKKENERQFSFLLPGHEAVKQNMFGTEKDGSVFGWRDRILKTRNGTEIAYRAS
jgi:hypothetical protein